MTAAERTKKLKVSTQLDPRDVSRMLDNERGDWRNEDLSFDSDSLLTLVQNHARDWTATSFAFFASYGNRHCYITAQRNDEDGFGMFGVWMRKPVKH